MNKIIGAIRKADLDFGLIENNDRICVGVSGGKDSMLLLYALSVYRKAASFYENKNFDVIGIHLEMGFDNMDFTEVRQFCKEHEIQYIDYPTKLYEILQLHPKKGKIQCSLCSTLKKGAIVKAAKEYNCNKTAFAHHADDAIETLFMNMMYGGRINTFTPQMFLTNQEMQFIRPLVYCFEDMIKSTVVQENIPVVKSTCPNDGFTKRQEVKELLQSIYKSYPRAKQNFLTSLSNQEQICLWTKNHE